MRVEAQRLPVWTLGDRLRKSREEAGIGSEEMADHLLRHRNTIMNWENDRTRPTMRALARWAELTSTPVWWLLDQEPPAPVALDRRKKTRHTSSRTRRVTDRYGVSMLVRAA